MALSEKQIVEALGEVTDPELGVGIVELGMVRSVSVRRGRVSVTVALTVEGCPMRAEITSRVQQALLALRGVRDVEVELTVMSTQELVELRDRLSHGSRVADPPAWSAGRAAGGGPASAGGSHAHHQHSPLGHEAGRQNPFGAGSRTRIVGISSGKGGVGKSSVTVNLAVALARAGHDVALLDADVYGFSIPAMLGIDDEPAVEGMKMIPIERHGVRCMSMGFFVDDEQPVVWRGPMLHKALEQFLVDVDWSEPEFLLVDMPPGTGDVALSMAQYLPASEVYVVTTPQAAARRVAQRTAYMARKLNLPLRGVIENMSWWSGPDGTRAQLFGEGGGRQLAEELSVPLLGSVPFATELRAGADEGIPVLVSHPRSEAARAFEDMATALAALGRARVFRPELTIS